jgi:polysaccharide export outer membrane protein
MKQAKTVIALVFVAALSLSTAAVAQAQDDSQKTRERSVTTPDKKTGDQKTKPASQGERLEPDDNSKSPSDIPVETLANRREQIGEEAAVVSTYNNFFSTYRLGPEDVISVNVFGQDRYSRANIVIPPSGRIALALIPDGIFVNGRTVEEVSELIRKRYDEYIVDPQVSVSLDKAASYRYSVVGDVLQPGIRLMTRRMTVSEAIAEAGGVTSLGSKSGVYVLRRQSNGMLQPIAVNVSKIYKGQLADNMFLVPGDQIVVPGNKMKKIQQIMGLAQVASFARVFTGGLIP